MSDPDRTYIAPLSTEPSLVTLGGKGKSLASLSRAGFPIPSGFHITTAAYQQFVTANQLQQSLLDLVRPVVREAALTFDAAADEIQGLFMRGTIPDPLLTGITAAFDEFAEIPVAVRSSATAEDLPEMSFAGQQDTYLNVLGLDALLEATKSCWASLWTARAMSYRHQMAIPQSDIAMAVVVQRMVNSEVSGVLFTANPATGERQDMIVNASYGLGEAIVSGQVTPDAYVVERPSLTVKEATIGAKEQMVVADGPQGTRLEKVEDDRRVTASLGNGQLLELANLAVAVETHYDGQPQDIEWLFADDILWLLQSRPITNLPPQPLENVRWEPPEPNAFLSRSQLVEHIPDPVSTLFEDLHMKTSLQYFWGLNLAANRGHDHEDTLLPACFCVQTTINGYAYRHVGEPPASGRLPSQQKTAWLPKPVSTLLYRLKRYWVLWCVYLWWVPEWRYFSLPRYLNEIDRWAQLDPASASTEQLWKGIRELSRADARYWYRGGVWNAFSLTRGFEYQLHNFLTKNAPGRFTSGQFLSGLKSLAFNGQVALWRIARQIGESESLHTLALVTPPRLLMDALRTHPDAGAVVEALDRYLDEYGHQIFTLDFAEPSEAEAPEKIIKSLHALVLQAGFDPLARQEELARKRRITEAEANACFHGRLKLEFRWLLWKARHFYPNREEAMFYMGKAWTVLRPFAHELGLRLVQAGTLSNPDDIYFLNMDELSRAVRALVSSNLARKRGFTWAVSGLPEYLERASERRELREARRSLIPPFHVPGPPPWAGVPEGAEEQDADLPDNALSGSAVSPGKVTAKVSLILSPADFDNMRPGTVLVCPTTTPAWTQLFPQAVGLVTDVGGILAHGSIVAREYGIPAVLGIDDATQQIRDGQTITVDGDRGIVTLEDIELPTGEN